MLTNNIISSEFDITDEKLSILKKKYVEAEPFSHIVLQNFFKEDFLSQILKDFPDLSKKKSSEKYLNKNEIKLASNDYNEFPENIKILINYLNSDEFIIFLQKITSIKEKLIADKNLNGGGLHEIKRGGLLKVHTDFNRHPDLNLDRRLNLLLYLNKNWDEEYGGYLELWDKEMKFCKRKILPTFNTMVIFNTTDFSNHGHPDPLNCPNDRSRKSIATYYFSDGRPKEEIINRQLKNTTNFKDREGYENETFKKKENIKNFFRKFNFYKNLKNIEKKFFRTGKSKKDREKEKN